ncbi:MAG: ribbon-helix-helix protein, CopG family [Thermoflexaceae bacterium]|nr:ribbon-helix-helix protein, CopG family [Thermoflexaceae bacterium]
MKRTTISWPEEIAEAVEREARRRRVSVSSIVREIVDERLGVTVRRPREIPFAGVGASGEPPHAAALDDFLAKHWADDLDRDRG